MHQPAHWCLWVSCTHTKHQIPLHIHASSPTPYADIVQANDRLLSALKCFFSYSFSVWMSSGWIIVYFATCFYPKPHPVSVSTHTPQLMFSSSVLLCQKETLGDLPSLLTSILCCRACCSCNYADFCQFQAFVRVYIDINVVFSNET